MSSPSPKPAALAAATSTALAAELGASDYAATVLMNASTAQRRRLREVWRSAGWPWRDALEAELLAAGWLACERDAQGRDTVHLTPSGVALLAHTLQRNRARHDAHEALVARVAREMQRAGRVVWRGLSLRARVQAPPPPAAPAGAAPSATGGTASAGSSPAATPAAAAPTPAGLWASGLLLPDQPASAPFSGPPGLAEADANTNGSWVMAMPDVYSIRHTTVEAYLAPVAHEIKVQRSDLLADLRRPAKGEAYRWLAGECWYVIREGIARPEEIPEVYGVLVAPPQGPLLVARPAPQRSMQLPFAVWMALARASPEPLDDSPQALLGGRPEPTIGT